MSLFWVDITPKLLEDIIINFVDPAEDISYNNTIDELLEYLKSDKVKGCTCSFSQRTTEIYTD
jgi:hypothetical protein